MQTAAQKRSAVERVIDATTDRINAGPMRTPGHHIELARENGSIEDARVRQGLAHAWSKVQIMRINGLRSLDLARSAVDIARERGLRHCRWLGIQALRCGGRFRGLRRPGGIWRRFDAVDGGRGLAPVSDRGTRILT